MHSVLCLKFANVLMKLILLLVNSAIVLKFYIFNVFLSLDFVFVRIPVDGNKTDIIGLAKT